MKKLITTLLFSLSLLQPLAYADTGSEILLQTQRGWAEANYNLQGKAQIEAFEELITKTDLYLTNNPDDADLWIWNGIVKSTQAGAKGGLGALSLAKSAKQSLEKALAIDPNALDGSAYTSLGTLYHKVPGWPIGFGSDKKAAEFLKKALAVNPNGIDANYFYGEFLYDEGEYTEAKQFLMKAKQAAPRPGRELADQGRQKEIDALLAKVEKKLN